MKTSKFAYFVACGVAAVSVIVANVAGIIEGQETQANTDKGVIDDLRREVKSLKEKKEEN